MIFLECSRTFNRICKLERICLQLINFSGPGEGKKRSPLVVNPTLFAIAYFPKEENRHENLVYFVANFLDNRNESTVKYYDSGLEKRGDISLLGKVIFR